MGTNPEPTGCPPRVSTVAEVGDGEATPPPPTDAPVGSIGACSAPPRRVLLEAALLFVALLFVLLRSSGDFGLTWDESFYFDFADSLREWTQLEQPFSAEAVQRHWAYDRTLNPHPPFMRILCAIGTRLCPSWIGFPTSYRLANLLYISGCLAISFVLLRPSLRPRLALVAILFVFLQPRLHGHMLVAATDSPVAMAWLVLTLLAWRISHCERRTPSVALWVLFFAVSSFATATKFTGFLALPPLLGYFLWRRRLRAALLVLAACALGLCFMVLVSVDTWADPLGAVRHFLVYPFTRHTVPIPAAYGGKLYVHGLPWHYAAMMTLHTYTLVLTSLMAGLFYLPKAHRQLGFALLFPVGFWLILVHWPGTPRHDGIRQFLALFPLLGLLSALGLTGFFAQIRREFPACPIRPLRVLGVAGPLVLLGVGLLRCHPHYLSDYNCTIGGIRGAERDGMELTYYFEAVDRGVLSAMNAHLTPGATLIMVPHSPHLLARFQKQGLLRDDFVLVDHDPSVPADYMLLSRRRLYTNEVLYRQFPALHEVSFNGVSLVKFGAARQFLTDYWARLSVAEEGGRGPRRP